MSALQSRIDTARMAFTRLTQREQMIVIIGAVVGIGVVLIGIGVGVSSAIGRVERRVSVNTEILAQVLELAGDYQARQRAQDTRLRNLKGKSKVRLVKLVEDAALNAGVDIGQLSPDEGQANEDGIVESRVDLRAQGLSIDRLQDFLSRLESSGGMVIVRRLKVNKPYRKETLNIDLTVTTFRVKS